MADIIRIRRTKDGIQKYVACDDEGYPIQAFLKLSDITKQYDHAVHYAGLQLIRELDQEPRKREPQSKVIKKAVSALGNRKPVRYGYIRVSTRGQAHEGNSMESQEKQLKEAGAEKIYADVFSGKSMDRPELDKLLKRILPGDTLIVTKIDRFARTIGKASEQITQLIDQGIRVEVLNLGVLDNSSVSTLFRNVLLAFAQFERDMIVERTQEGKAIAKQNPNFKEGRPKIDKGRMDHAMELLENHSYSQVVAATGISKSSLIREKKRRNKGETL